MTEALAAFLTKEQEAGNQPFDGDFFGELTRFDLAPDGTRVRVGRTDIEWRLYSFPPFIVEFKVISPTRRASYYVTDGMARFVDGRYAARSWEGAMWAFIVEGSTEDKSHVRAHVETNAVELRCLKTRDAIFVEPSAMAPAIAEFDSLHDRSPNFNAIRLAHLFVRIPAEH